MTCCCTLAGTAACDTCPNRPATFTTSTDPLEVYRHIPFSYPAWVNFFSLQNICAAKEVEDKTAVVLCSLRRAGDGYPVECNEENCPVWPKTEGNNGERKKED